MGEADAAVVVVVVVVAGVVKAGGADAVWRHCGGLQAAFRSQRLCFRCQITVRRPRTLQLLDEAQRTQQNRAEHSRTEPNTTEPNRTEPDRMG